MILSGARHWNLLARRAFGYRLANIGSVRAGSDSPTGEDVMTELFNCQDWRRADRFDPSVLLTIGVGISLRLRSQVSYDARIPRSLNRRTIMTRIALATAALLIAVSSAAAQKLDGQGNAGKDLTNCPPHRTRPPVRHRTARRPLRRAQFFRPLAAMSNPPRRLSSATARPLKRVPIVRRTPARPNRRAEARSIA